MSPAQPRTWASQHVEEDKLQRQSCHQLWFWPLRVRAKHFSGKAAFPSVAFCSLRGIAPSTTGPIYDQSYCCPPPLPSFCKACIMRVRAAGGGLLPLSRPAGEVRQKPVLVSCIPAWGCLVFFFSVICTERKKERQHRAAEGVLRHREIHLLPGNNDLQVKCRLLQIYTKARF